MTDSGIKCAWVIHESKAVQMHEHHSNRRCLYVPQVPGSVKNPHNNNNYSYSISSYPYEWLLIIFYSLKYQNPGISMALPGQSLGKIMAIKPH